jgi:hypothetical protein
MELAKGQESAVTSKRGSAGIESQCPAERVNVDHLLFSFPALRIISDMAVIQNVLGRQPCSTRLKQEPNPALGLIDPGFQHTRGCNIVCLTAQVMDLDHPTDQRLIVFS